MTTAGSRSALSSTDPSPSDPPPRGAPRWGLGDAFAGYGLGLLAVVVVGLVWAAVDPDAIEDPTDSLGPTVGLSLALWSGLVWAPLRATHRKGQGSLARDFGMRMEWRDVPGGLFAGALSQVLLVPLVYLPLSRFVDTSKLDEPARELTEPARGAGLLVLTVLLVLAAPVVEELFFRGLLLRALGRRFGTGWAVVGSSLGFAAAHVQGLQFPALFVFGLGLGVLTVVVGRLGPAIWAHVGFNAVTLAVLVAQR